MASSHTNPAINGSGQRKLTSWIQSFVEHTSNLESAEIWRKWAAISTIAAVLEQKVHVTTSSPLYSNLYVFLVGDAGIGKTRAISAAASILREIPELHIGPTSMTMASLVDHLVEAKRTIIDLPDPAIEYNSMVIVADELSAFMDEFEKDLIAGLTTFYDVVPYSQARRTKDIRIKIKRPQLNILSGSTPSNLLRFVPDYAWEQGFTSRVILIYSEERPTIDTFGAVAAPPPLDLIYDLQIINALHGSFTWDDDYGNAMNNWKRLDCNVPPKPNHPKLRYYNNRRFAHMIKLTMIAAVDRGNKLHLTKSDFNTAMGWLIEAEGYMPEIFRTGIAGADAGAMDEIYHFVANAGTINESQIVRFASKRIPGHSVMRVFEIMQHSGMIAAVSTDPKTGLRMFRATAR